MPSPHTITTNQNDSLTADPSGARITLTLKGIPILTQITRGDGKVGHTHPCTPVFGPDRDNLFDLPQHGSLRNQTVQVSSDDNQITFNHQITEDNYPKDVYFQQTLTLKPNHFTLQMSHTNNSTTPIPLNSGEHCYFHAPKGFQSTKLNSQDLTPIITSHKDGIAVDLKPKNSISIPELPTITLTQSGFSKAMIWVGSTPDLIQKDSNYVCIEPVEADPNSDFFGSPDSLIQPGQTRTAQFSLSLK